MNLRSVVSIKKPEQLQMLIMKRRIDRYVAVATAIFRNDSTREQNTKQ